uniref:Uncharacterized protein n=1 Tax=Arundo donax TaxID=35708 RepID=A0A0A9D8F6_ARUDO
MASNFPSFGTLCFLI